MKYSDMIKSYKKDVAIELIKNIDVYGTNAMDLIEEIIELIQNYKTQEYEKQYEKIKSMN